jgi:hypothetical protein
MADLDAENRSALTVFNEFNREENSLPDSVLLFSAYLQANKETGEEEDDEETATKKTAPTKKRGKNKDAPKNATFGTANYSFMDHSVSITSYDSYSFSILNQLRTGKIDLENIDKYFRILLYTSTLYIKNWFTVPLHYCSNEKSSPFFAAYVIPKLIQGYSLLSPVVLKDSTDMCCMKACWDSKESRVTVTIYVKSTDKKRFKDAVVDIFKVPKEQVVYAVQYSQINEAENIIQTKTPYEPSVKNDQEDAKTYQQKEKSNYRNYLDRIFPKITESVQKNTNAVLGRDFKTTIEKFFRTKTEVKQVLKKMSTEVENKPTIKVRVKSRDSSADAQTTNTSMPTCIDAYLCLWRKDDSEFTPVSKNEMSREIALTFLTQTCSTPIGKNPLPLQVNYERQRAVLKKDTLDRMLVFQKLKKYLKATPIDAKEHKKEFKQKYQLPTVSYKELKKRDAKIMDDSAFKEKYGENKKEPKTKSKEFDTQDFILKAADNWLYQKNVMQICLKFAKPNSEKINELVAKIKKIFASERSAADIVANREETETPDYTILLRIQSSKDQIALKNQLKSLYITEDEEESLKNPALSERDRKKLLEEHTKRILAIADFIGKHKQIDHGNVVDYLGTTDDSQVETMKRINQILVEYLFKLDTNSKRLQNELMYENQDKADQLSLIEKANLDKYVSYKYAIIYKNNLNLTDYLMQLKDTTKETKNEIFIKYLNEIKTLTAPKEAMGSTGAMGATGPVGTGVEEAKNPEGMHDAETKTPYWYANIWNFDYNTEITKGLQGKEIKKAYESDAQDTLNIIKEVLTKWKPVISCEDKVLMELTSMYILLKNGLWLWEDGIRVILHNKPAFTNIYVISSLKEDDRDQIESIFFGRLSKKEKARLEQQKQQIEREEEQRKINQAIQERQRIDEKHRNEWTEYYVQKFFIDNDATRLNTAKTPVLSVSTQVVIKVVEKTVNETVIKISSKHLETILQKLADNLQKNLSLTDNDFFKQLLLSACANALVVSNSNNLEFLKDVTLDLVTLKKQSDNVLLAKYVSLIILFLKKHITYDMLNTQRNLLSFERAEVLDDFQEDYYEELQNPENYKNAYPGEEIDQKIFNMDKNEEVDRVFVVNQETLFGNAIYFGKLQKSLEKPNTTNTDTIKKHAFTVCKQLFDTYNANTPDINLKTATQITQINSIADGSTLDDYINKKKFTEKVQELSQNYQKKLKLYERNQTAELGAELAKKKEKNKIKIDTLRKTYEWYYKTTVEQLKKWFTDTFSITVGKRVSNDGTNDTSENDEDSDDSFLAPRPAGPPAGRRVSENDEDSDDNLPPLMPELPRATAKPPAAVNKTQSQQLDTDVPMTFPETSARSYIPTAADLLQHAKSGIRPSTEPVQSETTPKQRKAEIETGIQTSTFWKFFKDENINKRPETVQTMLKEMYIYTGLDKTSAYWRETFKANNITDKPEIVQFIKDIILNSDVENLTPTSLNEIYNYFLKLGLFTKSPSIQEAVRKIFRKSGSIQCMTQFVKLLEAKRLELQAEDVDASVKEFVDTRKLDNLEAKYQAKKAKEQRKREIQNHPPNSVFWKFFDENLINLKTDDEQQAVKDAYIETGHIPSAESAPAEGGRGSYFNDISSKLWLGYD